MTSRTYSLSKNAFLCNDDAYWIVLDLRHDRYICIEAERFARMKPLLAGWEDAWRIEPEPDTEQYCRELASHGVLTQETLYSKPARPDSIVVPTRSLLERLDGPRPGFSSRALLAFVTAAVRAHFNLKRRSLPEIVRELQARTRARPNTIVYDEGERVWTVVKEFELLRPYFPRAYLCLFDSLALLERLAQEGICPQWVFGVRAEPFGAHCWLQMDDLVINDSMDRILEYQPIMAI